MKMNTYMIMTIDGEHLKIKADAIYFDKDFIWLSKGRIGKSPISTAYFPSHAILGVYAMENKDEN